MRYPQVLVLLAAGVIGAILTGVFHVNPLPGLISLAMLTVIIVITITIEENKNHRIQHYWQQTKRDSR